MSNITLVKEIEQSLEGIEKGRQAIMSKSEENTTAKDLKTLFKIASYYKKIKEELNTYKNSLNN